MEVHDKIGIVCIKSHAQKNTTNQKPRKLLHILWYSFFFIPGQLKQFKKNRPAVIHPFSGITAKKATKNDHKGRKKHVFTKRHQDNQGFGKKSTRNTFNSRKKIKFENHRDSKKHHHKNKTKAINTVFISKQSKKKN